MPPQKRGEVAVAIDFSNQIYNFKGYKTDGQNIIQTKTYSIFSYAEALRGSFFTAQDIVVHIKNNDESIPLEDYAEKWILSDERDISIFNSKDFLEQTCITHCIHRIRKNNDDSKPFNEYLEVLSVKDKNILNVLLKILEPSIEKIAQQFCVKHRDVLEFPEVYAQAYMFCSLILAGENKNIIQDLNNFRLSNPKQKSRQHDRYARIHPLRTHKNSKNIDIEKISKSAIEEIICKVNPVNAVFLLPVFQDDVISSVISEAINFNSDKIYKPWFKENIVDFMFGKKGQNISLVYKLLRDHFKTEIRNRKVSINTDCLDSDVEVEQSYSRRGWYKDCVYSVEVVKMALELTKDILPKKQMEAYKMWLDGTYNSLHPNERQNLKKAKDRIKSLNLNIPIPKSQKHKK